MSKPQACTANVVLVKSSDLPLSCPMEGQRVWDAHPRVYLDIMEAHDQEIRCPYCSTLYKWVEA